jgi:transcriptional regulator with XRE-family HTH domain
MERAPLLKQARLKKRLTREEVAERLDVDPTTVTRWEKGATTPQPINLLKLCELYGVTAQALGFDELLLSDELPLLEKPPVVTQNTTTRDEVDDDPTLLPFRKQDLTLRLMRIPWNWPDHNARYQELQVLIPLQLEDNSSMNSDELITRRDAVRRLALLPIEICGLSALYAVLKRPREEILAQCAAGIIACWYLQKGKDLAFANTAVSMYIPTLKELAKSAPAAQRKAAAELLVQCLLLKSTLSREVYDGSNEAVMDAQQAEKYSEMAENHLFQVLALRTQASAYSYGNQWEQALLAAEKARYLLAQKQENTVPAVVQSYVYAGLANYQAYHGKKQDALASLGKAHTLFFAQSPDEPVPLWIHHNKANLILNDGMVHYHLGLQKQALDSLAQIGTVEGRSEVIYVESLMNQVMAEISRDDQPRDIEWCIDLWIKGIEGAKMLQSRHWLNQGIQAYTALCAACPGEKRMKELREYILH